MLRRGQVALYLLLAIVIIALLTLMNVNAFVSVRAKNRAMNAGDAAALAAAEGQRDCLNRIGELNLSHLRLALETRLSDAPAERLRAEEACAALVREQREICLLGPLEAFRTSNRRARDLGASQLVEMQKFLRDHVDEIRTLYRQTPDLYPPSWEDAGRTSWDDYLERLTEVLSEGVWAGPDNIEYMDAVGGHLLLLKAFYQAVGGRAWCWFKFNAPGILDSYGSYRDWSPLPREEDRESRRARAANSEIYSLHLEPRQGSAMDLLGTNLICRLTGCQPEELLESVLLTNRQQVWFFYRTDEAWRKWSTYPRIRFNSSQFPIRNDVRPEYDVLGCAAICRTEARVRNIRLDAVDLVEQIVPWSAGAKPFGTVVDERGELTDVTALNGFVTSAFREAHLVPIDSVGGRDLSTSDYGWAVHVRDHLPPYLEAGTSRLQPVCFYCQRLAEWEQDALRNAAKRYLKYEGANCVRPTGASGNDWGGTMHGR